MVKLHRAILSTASTMVLLFAAAVAHGQETNPTPTNGTVIANVGDVEITGVDIAIIAEKTFDQLSQLTEEQRSEYLVQTAVDMNLMALAATELGLDTSPLVERRLAFEKARLLQEAYVQHVATEVSSGENVQAAYEAYVAAFVPIEQRRLSHILVRSEDDAKQALERIKQGETFEAVGQDISIDPAAKTTLDLGFVASGEMVEPLDKATFGLGDVGEVTSPVSTQFGWHIIRFDERRMSEPDSLEASRERITNDLVAERLRTRLAELSDRYGVRMLDAAAAAEPTAD